MYMCASKWSFTVNMFVETLMRDMIRYENVARTKNKIKRQFQGVEFFFNKTCM